MLQNLENVLNRNQQSETDQDIFDFYGSDLSHLERLYAQLVVLYSSCKEEFAELRSVVAFLKSLSTPEKILL